MGAWVHRLLLRLGHQLLSVQPHRHHALVSTREAAHGSRIGLSADALGARRRLRRRPAQTLTKIVYSGGAHGLIQTGVDVEVSSLKGRVKAGAGASSGMR